MGRAPCIGYLRRYGAGFFHPPSETSPTNRSRAYHPDDDVEARALTKIAQMKKTRDAVPVALPLNTIDIDNLTSMAMSILAECNYSAQPTMSDFVAAAHKLNAASSASRL
jgi:hypothetical protein